MTLRPTLLLTAGLLALTACSTAGDQPNPAFSQNFVGVWAVTNAWAAGGVIGSPAPQGQTVAITTASATDPLGRPCSEPTYSVAPGKVATALGIDAKVADEGLVLDVTCGGRAFARYVAHGGALLSVADGWLFELQPAATVAAARRTTTAIAAPAPAAAPAAQPAAKPVAAPAKPPAKAAKPAPRPQAPAGEALYLASYRSQDNAAAGWAVLQKQAAGLKALQPVFKEVDLGAKGRFVRLYAAGASAQAQGEICAVLKKLSPDCGARY